ncbi:MAG TPA: cysteine desulfurase-like protein [Candidatus Thalassarchaeaceae archaeon]|nr:cysteine desulfurase-like protein [Candidatus Thalassarchaeaceae archaeon]
MRVYPIKKIRDCFPALGRTINGRAAVFFDGPGGSQVPRSVVDAVSDYLLNHNANTGMSFATSLETDEIISEALQACADFIGCSDPTEIAFGQNMTSLNIQLSSALSKTWGPGDEVVVTRLDHDGNVRPWSLAAEWSGATLRKIDVNPEDCTLDMDSAIGTISEKTVLVAVGAASNLSGTINDVRTIADIAHEFGAEVVVDAVHIAPHSQIDISEMECDFLLCSPYKFFGPHQGVLWGKKGRMEELPVAKLRVSSEEIPFRWMTGTQSHEGMAGTKAAIDHIAWIGRESSGNHRLTRREALSEAYKVIEEHEQNLCLRMLEGLERIDGLKVWGITEPSRISERSPTVSFTHPSMTASMIGEELGRRGIFVWAGNFYALELTETLGLEPEGVLRAGVLHYNSIEEVDYFVKSVSEILG